MLCFKRSEAPVCLCGVPSTKQTLTNPTYNPPRICAFPSVLHSRTRVVLRAAHRYITVLQQVKREVQDTKTAAMTWPVMSKACMYCFNRSNQHASFVSCEVNQAVE